MKNSIGKTVLFLAGQGVSLFGSSIVQFTMIWYVTKETSSGVLVSLLTICAFVPQMLMSLVSGAWADRYPKKRIIIIADAVIAAATLALALLIPLFGDSGAIVTAIMVTSIIRSLGTGVQQPAVNAFLPELVPQERLMKINGVNSAIQSVVQFVAPAAAGAVLTFSTMQYSLFIDIATAVVGIGLLSFIVVSKAEKTTVGEGSAFSDMKLGAKYTFSHEFLGKLLILFGIFIFMCVPAGFLATLFVTRSYGDTYVNMSIVEIVGFIGMMLGGVLVGVWGGFKNRMKTLLVGMLAFGLLAIGMGAVKSFIVYLILMAVYGVALTMVQTATITMVQEKSSPEMMGRVSGLMNAFYCGFLPLGMVVFGPLSDYISLNVLMIFSGVALVAMAIVIRMNRGFYKLGMPTEVGKDNNA